jgi:hypothetical protein
MRGVLAAMAALLIAPVAANACSADKQAMTTGVQVAQMQDKAMDAGKEMTNQATDAAKETVKETVKEQMPATMPSTSDVKAPAMPTTPTMPDAPKMPGK